MKDFMDYFFDNSLVQGLIVGNQTAALLFSLWSLIIKKDFQLAFTIYGALTFICIYPMFLVTGIIYLIKRRKEGQEWLK